MVITSCKPTVQTLSPFSTGFTWCICTPTLPAGCLPSKAVTVASFKLAKEASPAFTPTFTGFPTNLAKAEIPACKASMLPSTNILVTGAMGLESKVLTKTALAVIAGSATTSYGRCLIKGHKPASKSFFFTASASKLPGSAAPKSAASNLLSEVITTSKILRRSPRTTSVTSPLTGEVKTTSGLYLS